MKIFLSVTYDGKVYHLALVRRMVAKDTGHESLFPTVTPCDDRNVCIPVRDIDKEVFLSEAWPSSGMCNSPPILLLNTDWNDMHVHCDPPIVPPLSDTSEYRDLLDALRTHRDKIDGKKGKSRGEKRKAETDDLRGSNGPSSLAVIGVAESN